MIEFRDESVLEPVDEHFGNHDGHDGLNLLYQLHSHRQDTGEGRLKHT